MRSLIVAHRTVLALINRNLFNVPGTFFKTAGHFPAASSRRPAFSPAGRGISQQWICSPVTDIWSRDAL